MRRSTAFSKVMPMGSGSLRGASSPRKSVVARLRLRASTVLAMQRLNPFAHRQRRRRRRRSATTDQIVSTQHASALSAVSMRSDDREQESRTRRALETARRTASGRDKAVASFSNAPAEYLVGLSTFFFACDYDEDGALSQTELRVMLEVLLTQDKAAHEQNHKHRKASRKRRRTGGEPLRSPGGSRATLPVVMLFDDDEEEEAEQAEAAVRGRQRVPIEQFMDKYGHRLFARGVELPSVDFVRRCQRLKVGFKRCDTNGDNVMSVQELEIALQKLDLVVADDDLQQLVASLDANGDGAIEWSEMVRAAWLNMHLGPARNRNSVLLLDALADVPAAAIGRPHYIKSTAGSTASVHAAGRPESPGDRASKSKSKIRKPTWLMRAALRMHLVLPQDARRSAGNSAGESDVVSQPRGPSKSRVERLGVRILTRISMQQVQAMKRGNAPKGRRSATSSPTRADARPKPKPRAVSTPQGPTNVTEASPAAQSARVSTTIARTRLTVAMRRRVVRIEWIATALAALVGVACGLLSIRLEAFVPRVHGQDEFSGDTWYYVYLAAINVAVSLVEVNLMYLAAVVCAFRMTVATRLTLYPQDAEREFLTRAIARAALQVGHRKDTLFGMDPMKDSPRLVLLCSFLLYRSKRYILKFLIKLFIRRVLWRAAAKTVLSVLVLPLNAALNAWTLHSVMRHCRVTIIGPPCITALLEDFFARQEPKLLPYQRVDYLRVLGCALVCKRCVHPNLEIVVHQVRHKWVTAAAWPIGDGCSCLLCPDEPCELHELDDTDRFLASLLLDSSRLSPATAAASICQVLDVDHQRNIFFFLIVALIVDGELSLGERRLYMRACQIAHMECDWAAVRRLKDEFLHGYGLRLDGVFEIIVPRPPGTRQDESLTTPWFDWLLYVGDRISSLLAV